MKGKDSLQDGEGAKKVIQNKTSSASIKYLQKKKDQFFQVSKKVFTYQMFSVIWQIQLTHCSVMLITGIDLIIKSTSEKQDLWYNYAMVLVQFLLSIGVLIAVNKRPFEYNKINTVSCIIIHSIWAILQVTSEYYQNRGGMSYMIGILSFLMIQNSSNSRAKFFLVAFNTILFCTLSSHSSEKDIHYVAIIAIAALYAISSEEDGREQLMKEIQQMFELKNVLPQSLLVAAYDKTVGEVDLQTFNNKAQSIFNLNGSKKNFHDFCDKVTIHRIEKSKSIHQIGGRSTGLRSVGGPSGRSGRSGREYNETLFYLEEESQNRPSGVNNNEIRQPPPLPPPAPLDDEISRQGINLHTFLLNRFKKYDEDMQRGIGKSSSIQSQDKKSTKTQLAAGTTAGVASKSFFAQSKTLINMLTTQKSNKKMMLPHHSITAPKGKVATKKNQEFRCVFKRKVPQPDQANEQDPETVDELHFTLKIGVYTCIDEYFIVLSLEETGIDERYHNFSRRAKFYEQFCQQSLLKTNEAVLNLVNELKQLISRSSVITEADLNRFIGSNLNIGTGGGDSALSNNLKSQGSNIGTTNQGTGPGGGGGGSIISNPLGGNTNKGIYCVPKRFMENIHQQGILTNNIIGNFANYFAMKDNKRQDIEMKPFSIMKVIKNIQRLFQRTIDRKGITVLINQQQEPIPVAQSSPPLQSNPAQMVPLSHNTSVQNVNPNSSARDFSMIPLIMSANNFQPSATHKNSNNELQTELFSTNAFQLRIIAGQDSQQHQQQPQKKQSQSTPAHALAATQKVCDEITNDEAKFQHLIFNLFQNAVQYTPVYGLIAIQIQRDHKFEECIKIRIRNTCPNDFLFPFANTKGITLNWEDMLEEFETNESFFYGTKMAAQLSFILGPYNSLQFQNLENNELQVDFLVFDFSQSDSPHQPHDPRSICKSDPSCEEKSQKESHTQPARVNNISEKYEISSHQNQIRIDSCDSFDKWIKIQSLEQQKAKSTLKIRNQLQFKN